ncbi:MAG: DUF882 domain-containing protein [Nitrosomonas sp.]|nr:DUF882 domain-containing protein [Nitrosomonas sp.]MDP1952051.1 DUF882 domain-containing protein [Nitrosomonas sp.]
MFLRKLIGGNCQSHTEPAHSRRRFLKTGIGACTLLTLPLALPQAYAKSLAERKLDFLNLHTGERVQSVYWAEGQYIPDALQAIGKVLRDHRTGDIHAIDTNLLNMLHLIHSQLDSNHEFHVISGYRSPATNGKLSAHSNGVAKRSLHMQGKAIDVRLSGYKLTDLRAAALSLAVGGVGFYPGSDFLHLDTGQARSWAG